MTVWGLSATQIAAVAIFLATYVAVAIGRMPGLRVDRAGAALIGAGLMVACGVLSLEQAYRAIDLDTITLLLGMMIVVANLRLSGFFRMVTGWAAGRAHHPALLLVAVVVTTGLLSAVLVNDAICLVMTPIVITLTRALGRNPVPYLIAVALSSNVGSTATITGNPQNMIIGNLSGMSYGAFAAALAPVAAAGLLVTILVLLVLNPREFLTRRGLPRVTVPSHYHGWLAAKSALVSVAMIGLFFTGQPVAKVAICAAALLLLTRRIEPKKVYAEIDGQLLLMFAGLFVVVAGLEHAVLTKDVLARACRPRQRRAADRRHRRSLQPRQQRSGRAGAEAFRRAVAGPDSRLARRGDGIDPRRKLHAAGLGRQSDRGRARRQGRRQDRFLDLFQGWGAAYRGHHGHRSACAGSMRAPAVVA